MIYEQAFTFLFFFFWYMKFDYYCAFIIKTHDLGLSILPLYKVKRETLATLTTLKRTPGTSPTAWPLQPNPATRTSSFSSIKFKQPSLGTKGVIFWPFLISWTLTHFLMAEFGCLVSTPTFSSTIPLAPPKQWAFRVVPKWAFLYCLSCYFWSCWWLWSFLGVRRPRYLPVLLVPRAWAKELHSFIYSGMLKLFCNKELLIARERQRSGLKERRRRAKEWEGNFNVVRFCILMVVVMVTWFHILSNIEELYT